MKEETKLGEFFAKMEKKKELFTKDGTPKCPICGKPMVMATDSITKKKSKYLWKFDCDCCPNKNLRLCVG